MSKLSIICLWAFIVLLLLGVLSGVVATILQFVVGDIANGFSDLLWTCTNGGILAATVGVKVHENKTNDSKE